MIKPKCTCGAYAVGSVVHTDDCEVREAERMEAICRKVYGGTIDEVAARCAQVRTRGILERKVDGFTIQPKHVCQWAEYEGLTNRFQFCTICDRKRGGNA